MNDRAITERAPSYAQWKTELVTPLPAERRGDRQSDPKLLSGFWRLDGARTKPSYPVAIWTEAGQDATIFQIGRKHPMNTVENATEWHEFTESGLLHCVAVTRADWNIALESGFWPSDNKHSRQMSDEEKLGIEVGSGDNAAPVEESLGDQIATLAEIIDALREPTTQEAADKLSGHLDKMRGLLKLLEAERVKEKEPHLEASRLIDAKYKSIGEPGGDAYRKGDERKKAFLRKEQARIDAEVAAERKRQQDIVDAENEKRRLENQRRLDEAQDHGGFDPSDPTDIAPELLPEIAAPVIEAHRAKAGGAFSRASGLRKVKVGVITDRARFTAALTNQTDFNEWLDAKAQKLARIGTAIEGMKIVEELQ